MAMPFARPDPSSPASIADAGFSTSRRGFDQAEVREFLRMIAAELGRLQERERFLERELRTAQTNPDLSTAQLDDAALTRLLGEETARVLTTARESAAEIRQKAEQAAAQLVSEASDEATRIREEAEIEASRRRSDAAADAEAEVSMAKQQGREMVNEARAYRERVLSELARRRELAREQIEQLLHGRDRLMQSFERARLVAVDVVAELQPLGEPDEYVNLSPTTGPVPVMLPNQPAPELSAEPEADADVEVPEAETAPEPAEVESAEVEANAEVDDEPADLEVEVEQVEVEQVEVEQVEVEQVEVDPEAPVPPESDAETVAPGAGGDEDGGDEDGGDVVVDLFARLRAESVTIEPEEDDADAAAALVDEQAAPADQAVDDQAVDDQAAEEEAVEEATAEEETVEATPFERRDADLTPIIVTAARKLKRVLADEQNQVLETLRRTEPVRDLDAVLPGVDEHVARYAEAISDELHEATTAAAAMVGRTAKLRTTDAAAAATAATEVLAEWLIVPLRERLERCVVDGDGDNPAISRRVRAVYREWKTQHIDEQLDDVVRAAHGRGVLAAVEAGTPVIWICDAAHPSCADCDDNTLAGAVAAGEAFPTGHTFAPAHIGCRCLLTPQRR